MIGDYFKLALKNLTQRKLRSWLTMIGIFIGIAAVVSLISLGQGLEDAITEQFLALGANTVTVQPKSSGFGPPGTLAASKLTEDDLDEVQRVSGVSRAFGRLIKPVQVDFNDEREFVFLASVPPEREDRQYLYDARDMRIQFGRFLEPGDKNKVMVGNRYYREETFGRPLRAGDKITLQNTTVEVVGIFARTGSPEVDIAFQMNEDAMRELLDNKEEYSAILARTSEGKEVETVAESIERALRSSRDVDEGEEDFDVETSGELLDTFGTILIIVQIVLVGIAGISLVVGGIGIMNTMFTSVLERTREIGIMKSIGARNEDVMWIFLIESGLLGLTGGVIGIVLGMGLSKAVEYVAVNYAGLTLLQASFPTVLIIGALTFSFVVGTLSGILPARRASRMDPVEALRE